MELLNRRIILLAYLIVVLGLPVWSASQTHSEKSITDTTLFNRLSRIDSESLLTFASKSSLSDTLLSHSLIALSIVANRYYESPVDSTTRSNAVKAMSKLGSLYLTTILDYAEAYKYFMSAKQIAEEDENDFELCIIYCGLSNIFQNSQFNDKLTSESRLYLKKAMASGLNSGNESWVMTIAYNMAVSAICERSWGDFKPLIQTFKSHKFTKYGMPLPYITYMIEACDAFLQRDFIKCEKLLFMVKEHLTSSSEHKLVSPTLVYAISELYLEKGNIKKSIDVLSDALKTYQVENHQSNETMVLYYLSKVFKEDGNDELADEYYNRFLRLKEKLECQDAYWTYSTLKLHESITYINNEMKMLSLKRQVELRQRNAIIFAFILILVLALFLLIIYVNLKKNNKNLFLRNEEMHHREKQFMLIREDLEKRLAESDRKSVV